MPKNVVISIVDDDPSMREATLDLMNSLGYAAQAFPSAEAFLQSEAARTTSCLIADVQMPRMSGMELHGRLVASGNAIPTVLITAYPNDEVQVRALKAGAVGYLVKPFSIEELRRCMDLAFELRKAS